MSGITVERQRAILNQNLDMWENTKFQSELDLRVHKVIGSDTEVLANAVRSASKAEIAIKEVTDMLASLPRPAVEADESGG